MKTNFFIKIILQKRLSYICSVTKKQKNVVPRNEQSSISILPSLVSSNNRTSIEKQKRKEREK